MATTAWYVNGSGSDLNSGGSSGTTARSTCASAVIVNATKVLTQVGATFQTDGVLVTDAVNVQVAGVSTIFEIASVDSETQLTLVTAPADGTYAAKVGGARALIKKTGTTGAGNNAVLAASDTISIAAGTYTENAISDGVGVTFIGVGTVTVDGTGGAGGSDVFVTPGSGGNYTNLHNIAIVNAVDRGVDGASNFWMGSRVRISASGGNGAVMLSSFVANAEGFWYCSVRTSGAVGWQIQNENARAPMFFCESGDNVGDGIKGGTLDLANCLIYDNGGDGIETDFTTASGIQIVNCTIEGNTGNGVDILITNLARNLIFFGNIISNNATGVVLSSAVDIKVQVDYNIFFGNSTARSNFPIGTNDLSTDPSFTAPASDDYSIKSTGSAYKTGVPVFKNPTLNALNIGAVPGVGSTQTVGGGSGGRVPLGRIGN